VFRGPHRICVAAKAGCVEIFGRRSSGASEVISVNPEDGEILKDGLDKDGKAIGRRGASDVNVLKLISFLSVQTRHLAYFCAGTLRGEFWTARDAVESAERVPRPREHRRQSIVEVCD
jgi:hypothetical protein